MPSTDKRSYFPQLATVLTPLIAVTSLAAQTESTEPAPALDTAPSDEIVQLSPFSITDSQDQGYRASNSIAGTRSNTPIKDVPLNIQVFTKDLSDDLGITSQIELERYNAALVNGGADVHSDNLIQQAYNGFLFRGFVQNWGLRDGVRQYDPIDTQGLARVEIVKGPAAALYGLTYAGGVMNSITKDVDFKKNFTSIRLTGQSYGEYRGAIDMNYTGEAAGGKIGVRFNGVNAQTEDNREHSEGKVEFSQVNLAWKPAKSTELKFLAEKGYREKANGLGYFLRDNAATGESTPLQVAHSNIPWSWNWGDEKNMRSADTEFFRGSFIQSIGENLSITGYMQYYSRKNIDSDGWDAGGSGSGGSGASWDAAAGTGWLTLPDGTEVIRKSYHYRDWCNDNHAYGATAVYKLETGPVKNTFTAGANVWKEDFISYKGVDSVNMQDFQISDKIDTSLVSSIPTADYVHSIGSPAEDNSNDYYFASWQASALNNRLKTNVAVNRTNLKLVQHAATPRVNDLSKTSPMFGAMFDITREVSVFAVHSTSLFPTTDKNDFDEQLPAVVGKSNEFGIKTELFGGKVSGTISYYEISQEGGSQRDPSATNRAKRAWDAAVAAGNAPVSSISTAHGTVAWADATPDERAAAYADLRDRQNSQGDLVAGGEQESKGIEADLIIQPTANWQVMLSYAHNTQKVTKSVNLATVGQSTTGHIKDQVAMLTKYSFTEGAVKGLSLGIGMQYAGKALQDYSAPGNTARYNPSTFYAEFFANYKFKAFDLQHSIQLNVKNLTKQEEFVGWYRTSGSSFATARHEVPTKMRWSLTYGLDF